MGEPTAAGFLELVLRREGHFRPESGHHGRLANHPLSLESRNE